MKNNKEFDFKSIKTFEDACEKCDINVEDFNKKWEGFDVDSISHEKLKVIYKAINDGWEADYSNENEYKYYPYFRWNEISGFSFALSGYDLSDSTVSSLLSTNSEEKSEYIGNQFINLYNQMFGYSEDIMIEVKISKKKAIDLGLI